jgi:hypothetical protein
MEITKVEIDIFNNLKTNPNDNTVDKKNVIEYLKSKGFECVRDGFHSVYLKPKVTESFQVLGINYYLYWFLIVILFIVFILMIKKW